ncbi:uncharacterized protein EAF02_007663 [Botrytis sinoallii]|uniref:uncharacterized protein n=1 Tax=Botrytis sinoallii TaxID=1463999 RepID=UPI0018FF20DA|nr:uncharacterized protein EAF02_007663 [Botrytis sinoallii]KAF7880026.1 hypothetical protein EAF02_007663 [Botrytis sinoallii]
MQKSDEASKRTARSRTPTACLQCQKRKQKCSREQPCRHCSRRYPPVDCIYTFEGKHRMVTLTSPDRLSVPDDIPASFYTDQKTSAGRLSSIPSSQNYSSTVSNEAHHQASEQNSQEENMTYMPTFDITNSDPFSSKPPYQGVLSSAIPASVSGSHGEQEMDPNELDFRPVPQVPTNTPDQIPFYDYMNGPHIETGSWNQSSNLNPNSGMVDLQNFDQSYFVSDPMQTSSSQSTDVNGSLAFHQSFEHNEMSNLDNPPNISFSPGTPDRQNLDYGTTDGYSGSYY